MLRVAGVRLAWCEMGLRGTDVNSLRIDCQVGEDGIAVVSLGSSSETILAQALDVQCDEKGQPVVVLLDRLIVNPARYDTYRGWQPNGCYVTELRRIDSCASPAS